MAGCVPCFVIPLLLFIFHRYIQPIILRFWNPWEKVEGNSTDKKEECKFSCECAWNKKKPSDSDIQEVSQGENEELLSEDKKVA